MQYFYLFYVLSLPPFPVPVHSPPMVSSSEIAGMLTAYLYLVPQHRLLARTCLPVVITKLSLPQACMQLEWDSIY